MFQFEGLWRGVILIKLIFRSKVKRKIQPRTGYASPDGMYSSILSLSSALEGVGGQLHTPAALPSGKRRCTHFYSRLSGPQGLSGKVRKMSPPPVSP